MAFARKLKPVVASASDAAPCSDAGDPGVVARGVRDAATAGARGFDGEESQNFSQLEVRVLVDSPGVVGVHALSGVRAGAEERVRGDCRETEGSRGAGHPSFGD